MHKTKHNLPAKVQFCSKCVLSNQRPSSVPEFTHKKNREGAKYLNIDQTGICDACKNHEIKLSINWEEREKQLIELLDKYRKNNGEFPKKYFTDVMEYLDIKEEDFHKLVDEFRSSHLWIKQNNDWKLRHTVNLDGVDD